MIDSWDHQWTIEVAYARLWGLYVGDWHPTFIPCRSREHALIEARYLCDQYGGSIIE